MGQDVYAQAETRFGLSDDPSVEMNLVLSPQTDAALGQLASDVGVNKTNILSLALALLSVAVDAKKHGKRIAVIDADGKVENEITGL